MASPLQWVLLWVGRGVLLSRRLLLLQLLSLIHHILAFPFMLYVEFQRLFCVHNSVRSSAPWLYCRSSILSHMDWLLLLAWKGWERLNWFIVLWDTQPHFVMFTFSLIRSSPPLILGAETEAFTLVLLSSTLIAIKWISNCLTVSVLYCIPAGKSLTLDPVICLLVLPRAPGNHERSYLNFVSTTLQKDVYIRKRLPPQWLLLNQPWQTWLTFLNSKLQEVKNNFPAYLSVPLVLRTSNTWHCANTDQRDHWWSDMYPGIQWGMSLLLPYPVEFRAHWKSQAKFCSALSKHKQYTQMLCISTSQSTANTSLLHPCLETTARWPWRYIFSPSSS